MFEQTTKGRRLLLQRTLHHVPAWGLHGALDGDEDGDGVLTLGSFP